MKTPKEIQQEVLRSAPEEQSQIETRFMCNDIPELMHAQLGITSEAGEFADAMKKFLIYGRPLDKLNLKEELGDLLWYIDLASRALGITIEELREQNIAKLKLRYPESFNEKDALERKDKC